MPLYRFCPACGLSLPTPTDPEGRVVVQVCPACGAHHYQNAKPTASGLVIRDGRVLLGKRGISPFFGHWDVPGGLLEPWEHPTDGVKRELREETGLDVEPTELLGVWIDTYGPGGDYTLNFYYICSASKGEPVADDDVSELRFFSPADLPPLSEIAFENGRKALTEWLRQRAAHLPS